MTFNLINGSYKLFKKLIDTLLYIAKIRIIHCRKEINYQKKLTADYAYFMQQKENMKQYYRIVSIKC